MVGEGQEHKVNINILMTSRRDRLRVHILIHIFWGGRGLFFGDMGGRKETQIKFREHRGIELKMCLTIALVLSVF